MHSPSAMLYSAVRHPNYVYGKEDLISIASSRQSLKRPCFLSHDHDDESTGQWCPERWLYSSWADNPLVIGRSSARAAGGGGGVAPDMLSPLRRSYAMAGGGGSRYGSASTYDSATGGDNPWQRAPRQKASYAAAPYNDWRGRSGPSDTASSWRRRGHDDGGEEEPEWMTADVNIFDTVELKGFDDDLEKTIVPDAKGQPPSRFTNFFPSKPVELSPHRLSSSTVADSSARSMCDLANELHARLASQPCGVKGNPLQDPHQRDQLLSMLQLLSVKQQSGGGDVPPSRPYGVPHWPMGMPPPPPPMPPPFMPMMPMPYNQPPPPLMPPVMPLMNSRDYNTGRASAGGGNAGIVKSKTIEAGIDPSQKEVLVNAAKICDALSKISNTMPMTADRHAIAALQANISQEVLNTAMDVLKKCGHTLQEGKLLATGQSYMPPSSSASSSAYSARSTVDTQQQEDAAATKDRAVQGCIDQLHRLHKQREIAMRTGNTEAASSYGKQMQVLNTLLADTISTINREAAPTLTHRMPAGARVINSEDLERRLQQL